MGIFDKPRDESQPLESLPTNSNSGLEGNLRLDLPPLSNWQIEYRIDHEFANFEVGLDAKFCDASFFDSDDYKREIPSYLLDWEGKYCELMINCLASREDFEFRKTHERLGSGWRAENGKVALKIYLTRTEFRDVIQVLSQDHVSHSTATRDAIFGWLKQHDVQPTEELQDAFQPSDVPRIRIDIKNIRPANPENSLKSAIYFDVSRIYAW